MSDGARSAGVSTVSDADLIERVLSGDRDLYRVLVQRYQGALFRVAHAMVLDRDVADDMVQDTFVRAYVNLARCRNRGQFRHWLLKTLRNRTLDYLKEKRRRDVSLSDERVLRKAERAPAPAGASEVVVELDALEEGLKRLSQPLREAFVLRHVEQCSFEEISQLLGVGLSAVKMRVHRARQELSAWLEDPRVTEKGGRSS